MWRLRINKPGWLRHVYFFLKDTIEKSIVNVHLFYKPAIRHSKGENNPNGGKFDDWTEGFVEVDSCGLMKSFSNQAGFVTLNGAIGISLQSKDPLVTKQYVDLGGVGQGSKFDSKSHLRVG